MSQICKGFSLQRSEARAASSSRSLVDAPCIPGIKSRKRAHMSRLGMVGPRAWPRAKEATAGCDIFHGDAIAEVDLERVFKFQGRWVHVHQHNRVQTHTRQRAAEPCASEKQRQASSISLHFARCGS